MLGGHKVGILLFSLMVANANISADMKSMVNTTVQTDLLIKLDRADLMSDRVRAYDPIGKNFYEKVFLGKAHKNRNPLRDFDYWRYVTVYNVTTVEERIAYLPYFEEDCHDNSFFMAEWGESRTIKVTLSSEVKHEKLGLSASIGMSIEQGTTFSTQRRIKAVAGVKARHFPIKLSDTYEGVTYIQTFNSKTKKYGYLLPSRMERWTGGYPFEFGLDNQNVGFKVQREVLEFCPGYENQPGQKSEDLLLR